MEDLQEKLKKRSEEIFQNGPDFDEPQSSGDPNRTFEEDEDESERYDKRD